MPGQEEQQRQRGISIPTLIHRASRIKNITGGIGAVFSFPAGAVFIGIGLLVFLSLFIIFFTPGGAAPLEIPKEPPSEFGGTTSLNSCQFFRSGEGASFKSQKLLDYFQEASLKSGVPATLLAAIARVETPGSVNYTDETLPFRCDEAGLKSSTGALGIMQVSPPWATAGYDAQAVNLGASYLGLKTSQLIEADFCDPRENIFLAAGFIVKKMETLKYQPLGSGNDIKWNPDWTNNEKAIDDLATGYYGCLYYGGPDPKKCGIPPDYPNSYGKDLRDSLKSCPQMTAGSPSGCPAAGSISAPYGFNITDYPDVGNEGCGDLKRCHNGIDIAASLGTAIKSPLEGIIKNDSDLNIGGYKGNFVTITNQTSEVSVIFEHLEDFGIRQGATVSKGQIIGTVGDTGEGVTGPVLHYKIIDKNGKLLNPFRYLGPAFKSGPDALFSSDEISANDYAGKTSNNWGVCN